MRGNLVLALIGIAAALYVVSLFRPQYEETKMKGPARVIDGDTNEIAGRRIRIFGIDAPEEDQTCERGGGGTWYCGAEATRLLSRMARSQIVECRVRATDIYGRYVALCSVGDEDLGRAMVRSGVAHRAIANTRPRRTPRASAGWAFGAAPSRTRKIGATHTATNEAMKVYKAWVAARFLGP